MFFKPYRLIDRVVDARVIVYLIVDGRRDMQSSSHADSSKVELLFMAKPDGEDRDVDTDRCLTG